MGDRHCDISALVSHHFRRSLSVSTINTEPILKILDKILAYRNKNVSHITIEDSLKELTNLYEDADKYRFLIRLAEKYNVDHQNVATVAKSFSTVPKDDIEGILKLEEKLRKSLVPEYLWIFTQIAKLENGVKFLVDLRTDLLEILDAEPNNRYLRNLNNSLKDLIGMFFSIGFFKLQRVTWQSPCQMLQKISEYEAVHPMRNWTDLKRRVGNYRRCFVFCHDSMPSEPIVVLHTALTDSIVTSIRAVVTQPRMKSVDSNMESGCGENMKLINTAIFYSITSTQKGLTGIELGNYLIKKVVKELQTELPQITQFSTLSPIPGFRKWLLDEFKSAQKEGKSILRENERNALTDKLKTEKLDSAVFEIISSMNPQYLDHCENILMRLCCRYLLTEKRRGFALDPVAHFHLKNGAVIFRVNWMADNSPKGMNQSIGLMVNYRYFLDHCEEYSQEYLENQTIQASDQVRLLNKNFNSSPDAVTP